MYQKNWVPGHNELSLAEEPVAGGIGNNVRHLRRSQVVRHTTVRRTYGGQNACPCKAEWNSSCRARPTDDNWLTRSIESTQLRFYCQCCSPADFTRLSVESGRYRNSLMDPRDTAAPTKMMRKSCSIVHVKEVSMRNMPRHVFRLNLIFLSSQAEEL